MSIFLVKTMKRKNTWTEHSEPSCIRRCMFCNIFPTAPLCHNCSQLECYWPLSTNVGFATRVRIQDCEWKVLAGNICVASFDWSCIGPVS
uniref:Uncharacterized protein n=1 Tax=Tanacetum cinerariifolium TaxID=118510 RepID=A0A699GLJ7_TANCI|nr:hypothetical protein [Tanacetum cinerariifolium]